MKKNFFWCHDFLGRWEKLSYFLNHHDVSGRQVGRQAGIYAYVFMDKEYDIGYKSEIYICIVAANKYSSAGHHEQKNKKTTGQIKFSAVTLKQRIKLVLMTFSV